jgi:ABC-2 type transport system ATP-binding protein
LERASLVSQRSRFATDLSGGQKRRLSLATALVGEPMLVFLDEPRFVVDVDCAAVCCCLLYVVLRSTGLDPASRRSLWKLIDDVKARRSLLLTTHSMIEADVLCDRVAIMKDGRIVEQGTPAELKARYANHHTLRISLQSLAVVERALAFVAEVAPHSKLVALNRQTLSAMFIVDSLLLSTFFARMARSGIAGIASWSLADASLESVFLKLCAD